MRRPTGRGALGERGAFKDEAGFTTVGMVIALLLTLALVFSAAPVSYTHLTLPTN